MKYLKIPGGTIFGGYKSFCKIALYSPNLRKPEQIENEWSKKGKLMFISTNSSQLMLFLFKNI